MESVEKDVIKVNAKAGTRRFSIKTDEGCEFVTMTSIEKTSRNTVQCQSSIRKMQNRRTKREVLRLDDKELYQHLEKLHAFLCRSEDSYLEDIERTDTEIFTRRKGNFIFLGLNHL